MNTFKNLLIIIIDFSIIIIFFTLLRDDKDFDKLQSLKYDQLIQEMSNSEIERSDCLPNRYILYLKEISDYDILEDELVEYNRRKGLYYRKIKMKTNSTIEVSTYEMGTGWNRNEFDNCFMEYEVIIYYQRGSYCGCEQNLSYFNKKFRINISEWNQYASYDEMEVQYYV